MEEEFNLSEKEFLGFDNKPKYSKKDVKEFIKRIEALLLTLPKSRQSLIKLKKLAGDKLI